MLEQHAYPVIGSLFVRDVELAPVLNILRPIWTAKTETASIELYGWIDHPRPIEQLVKPVCCAEY